MIARPVPVAVPAALVVNAAALAAVAASWQAAAGRVRVADQLVWLTVASVAVIAAAATDAVAVVALRRRVVQRLVALQTWAGPTVAVIGTDDGDATPGRSVAIDNGGRLSHSPSCPLVAGKATADPAPGAPPCPVCRP